MTDQPTLTLNDDRQIPQLGFGTWEIEPEDAAASVKAALEAGNYAEAAAQFETFRQSYPGGPMTARAGLLRGEALEGAGDLKAAARAYLDTFSTDKTGPEAPQSLYRLGAALGQLGQTEQACVTLAEVGNRFPGDQAVGQAQSAMTDLGCP